MNLVPTKAIATSLISLMIVGVFAFPNHANAGWSDILGTFGIGNSSTSTSGYGTYSGYDYNSTSAQNDGDIKISKEVKEIGEDDDYHDKIQIRSGALVEVWIEVKNTSSKYNASTVVRDELNGNSVYVANSLRVNSQISQPGLTSGGLRLSIPSKGKVTIIYRMNVCGNSNYPMRAYASAPGVGAGTDAVIITTETFNVGGYDDTYLCMSQFQNTGATNYSTDYPNNSTGVNYGNPFAGWSGVNNMNSTAPTNTPQTTPNAGYNPFAGWTGVNNMDSPTTVQTNQVATDPFAGWTGVSNSNNTSTAPLTYTPTSAYSHDPFAGWTGVQTNDTQYTSLGYSVDPVSRNAVAYTPTVYDTPTNSMQPTSTYFVAPMTGVNKTAPFVFASILTLGFVAFRKRKLLFA